jgi:DNA modification methylase
LADPSDVTQLRPDPQNRRSHPARNLEMLTAALREVGASRSIVIDEESTILAGNGVVEAASRAGLSKVAVVDVDGDTLVAVRRRGLTAEQKRALAIYDNRTSELAEWNWPQLAADLAEGLPLDTWWTPTELAAQLPGGKPGQTDPDVVPPERATSIAVGDLFALGPHRLLCGDSTARAAVARLVGPEMPLLMVTDPPYGVDYQPGWRAAAGVNRNPHKMGVVPNDDRADWREAWACFGGDVAYVWHGGLKGAVVQASLEAVGFAIRAQIVWVKDRFALSRGDYHWQHEPCWYAVRSGKSSHRTDDRTQATIWAVPARDDSGHGHGTQKPVEVMARAIRNHDAGLVYEPFCGSGTTIIASEMFQRRCFGLELEPVYCQVAIDRWEAFTGRPAEKLGEVTS